MKLHASGFVALIGLAALASAQQPSEVTPASAVDGKVICRIRAFVNGEPIFDDEVRELILPRLMQTAGLPEAEAAKARVEIFKSGLDQLIEREVILSEARAKLANRPAVWAKFMEAADKEFDRRLRYRQEQAKIPSPEEFKLALESQGISLEKMRRSDERQFMSTEFIRSMVVPQIQRIGHLEVLQYYEEHPADFMAEDKIRWQDLFIDAARHPNRQAAKVYAEQIAQRAKNGEDFAALAKQFDNGDSSQRNGEGIGQSRGDVRPLECEATLFEMKPGEVHIIEFGFGFHIIRLAERTYAGKIPFDAKTQIDIRRKLQNIMAEREYKRIVNDLKRKATIQIMVGNDG